MRQPYEITEGEEVRIIGAVIRDDRRVLMAKRPLTGMYYLAGIKLGR